jgi:hypothetical protein
MNIKLLNLAVAGLVIFCLSGLAAAGQAGVSGSHANEILIGRIYQQGSNVDHLLFNFRRTAIRSGNEARVTRTYTYPDGRIAAIEKATYRNDQLVSYSLIEKQINAHGRAEIHGNAQAGKGVLSMRYTEGSDTDTNIEALESPTVVNDNIVPYLLAHWRELMQGKEVYLRYIVIPRTQTVGFNLIKSGETTWRGKPAVVIKMIPASFFIRLVVAPVYFTVEKERRQVVRYEGRITPKIKENGEWQDLDAVMVFHWKSRLRQNQ